MSKYYADTAIRIAKAEKGYIEKASNKDLNSKKANTALSPEQTAITGAPPTSAGLCTSSAGAPKPPPASCCAAPFQHHARHCVPHLCRKSDITRNRRPETLYSSLVHGTVEPITSES